MHKRIAILGSTGSIGTQALDVVREQPEHFQVELLTCGNNVDLLVKQALEFKPNAVVIGDASRLAEVKDILFPAGIKAYAGTEALEQCVRMEDIEALCAVEADGVTGAILGRSLYEGAIDFKRAQERADELAGESE